MGTEKKEPDYIARERALIQKLHDTGYAVFDGDKNEAVDFISSNVSRFTNYVNVVVKEQYMGPLWRVQCEQQDYIANMQNIDRERKICHDAAISSVNILNRMSENLGIGKFADIDTSDRRVVADFCGTYVNQVFNKGIGNSTMYDAAKDKQNIYDTQKHERELKLAADQLIPTGGDSMECSYQ